MRMRLPREALEFGVQHIALRFVQFGGRCHMRAREAQALVQHHFESFDDTRQERDAAMVDQNQ